MNNEVKTAEFVKGILGTDDILEDGIPHIAFVGRSNVGKSSVINSLVGRKNLVKSSSVPGKTREINFFRINDSIYFVDLPGYGFAKMGDKKRKKLRKLILWYLTYSGIGSIKVVLIVDVNIGATDFDKEMFQLLKQEGHEVVVIANKSDKLRQRDKAPQLGAIKEALGGSEAILFSAKKKEGREEALKNIL